jgi:hypothetical protein
VKILRIEKDRMGHAHRKERAKIKPGGRIVQGRTVTTPDAPNEAKEAILGQLYR